MAKSNYIYLSGKGYWLHRLFEIDEFKGKQFWSLRLYPDPKSWVTFATAQLQQHKKEDADGKFITLRRYLLKPPTWKLKPDDSPEFNPPQVTDADGNDWPEDKLIGNGSAITVKVEVFDTTNGRGARMEAVRVDEWIEYIVADNAETRPDDEDSGSSARPF